MSNLVDELKKEHTIMAETLAAVRTIGITTPEGQKKLQDAKRGLLAHLKKEDEQLYPLLWKEAQKDKSLKRTLTLSASDMDTISKTAFEFFEKYTGADSGIEFAKDFGRLLATLTKRIYKEENTIYVKYNEIAP